MSTLQEIEQAILQLPESDYSALRDWFAERDAGRWDAEFEADATSGRLDALGEEALRAFREGHTRPL